METNKKNTSILKPGGADFFIRLSEESWTYIKTVVDVVREPVLILDKDLCVMAANEPFYKIFQVEAKDTEHTLVYKLGDGQWNIPSLRKLLEDVLPKNTFFKGFEVTHDFPIVGNKTIILNARQIHFKEDVSSGFFPPIILLAMEDVTEMMNVAQLLAEHTKKFQTQMTERTIMLEKNIKELTEEILKLNKKV